MSRGRRSFLRARSIWFIMRAIDLFGFGNEIGIVCLASGLLSDLHFVISASSIYTTGGDFLAPEEDFVLSRKHTRGGGVHLWRRCSPEII